MIKMLMDGFMITVLLAGVVMFWYGVARIGG